MSLDELNFSATSSVLPAERPGETAPVTPWSALADDDTVAAWNAQLWALDARGRVEWALRHLPGTHALSSSFGAQSAVLLHLVNQLAPGIPVVLVDTGYLFPETYQFIDQLSTRLKLNLKTYRAESSPAWQEARYGKLWEQGLPGIEKYNRINKVEPMERALAELGVGTWLTGLRRDQSASRALLQPLVSKGGRAKLHPILDWRDRDVGRYLAAHQLPYHPLWEQGYVSIGDVHTTRPLEAGLSPEQTRFFGLKRECGLHE